MIKKIDNTKSTKPPLVSVVMSAYNAEKYIKEAIDSILGQTFTDFEFIIINDGSTDGTLKIIKSYKDPRIVLISRKNKGLVASLNEGIERARGKYIARMDADDISMPERFEKQVEYLESHPEVGVVSSFVKMVDPDGNDIGIWQDDVATKTYEEITNMIVKKNCFSHPSVVIRTKIIKHYKYRNIKAAEDYELWLRMVSDGIVLAKIPEFLYLYRQHDSSTMAGVNNEDFNWRMAKMKLSFLSHQLKQFKLNIFNIRVFGATIIHICHWLTRVVKSAIKKILFISSIKCDVLMVTGLDNIYGGGQVYLKRLSENLFRENMKIAIMAPQYFFDKASIDSNIISIINQPTKRSNKWTLRIVRYAKYLAKRRQFIKYHPNTVHFHDMGIDFSPRVMRLLITYLHRHGIRVVFTAHTLMSEKLDELTIKTLSQFDQIICVCEATKFNLVKTGLDKNKLTVIYTGINLPIKDNKSLHEPPIVAWVGRFESIDKNPLLFVKVAQDAQQENINLRFLMYGDGDEKQSIESYIDKHNLTNIECMGFVHSQQDIYNNCDVLCTTSRSEALSLVILEAMAYSLPVVATDVGGNSEIIIDKENGRLVKGLASRDVLDAIQWVVGSRQRYSNMSKASYQRVKQDFSESQMIDKMKEFYGFDK